MNGQISKNLIHSTDKLMPVIFVGHGNPMNALEHNKYSQSWKKLVIQLSMNSQFTIQQHYQFAHNLTWLRKQGYLIMSSGNIVHHLGLLDWDNKNEGYPWANLVRNKTNQYLLNVQHDKLINYKQNGQQFIKAINSKQHYIPLMYTIGTQTQNDSVTIFNDTMNMGSLSMTSVVIADKSDKIHDKIREMEID